MLQSGSTPTMVAATEATYFAVAGGSRAPGPEMERVVVVVVGSARGPAWRLSSSDSRERVPDTERDGLVAWLVVAKSSGWAAQTPTRASGLTWGACNRRTVDRWRPIKVRDGGGRAPGHAAVRMV